MAERHPRDLDKVRDRLLRECRRPGFAAVARYKKPIGKGVEGPSIRFAETAIRLMGNISVDQMTVYDDKEKRIMRIAVVDCETNTPYSSDVTIEKTVERRSHKQGEEVIRTRQNKNGDMLYIIPATEDDLLNKQNALISKAIRSNGLRLIPGDIVDECMQLVLRTQEDENAKDPDASRRKLFDAFSSIGVTPEMLKSYLGHAGATLTPSEVTDLRAQYTAIRDGETSWREVMEAKSPVQQEGAASGSTTATLKQQLSKSETKRLAHLKPSVDDAPVWPKSEVDRDA